MRGVGDRGKAEQGSPSRRGRAVCGEAMGRAGSCHSMGEWPVVGSLICWFPHPVRYLVSVGLGSFHGNPSGRWWLEPRGDRCRVLRGLVQGRPVPFRICHVRLVAVRPGRVCASGTRCSGVCLGGREGLTDFWTEPVRAFAGDSLARAEERCTILRVFSPRLSVSQQGGTSFSSC